MKLNVSLNSTSIQDAINALKNYEKYIESKTDKLKDVVAYDLRQMVRDGFNGAPYQVVIHEGASVPDVQVDIEDGDRDSRLVTAHGIEAVFAEFGAGVYYNPDGAPHPARGQGIVGIGEYGYGYGKRKVWGYYDESGELKLTHGTPASMPMYLSSQRMKRMIPDIAKEVFKNGGE